jgi:hypothetical protein
MTRDCACHLLSRRDASPRFSWSIEWRETKMQVEVQLAAVRAFQANLHPGAFCIGGSLSWIKVEGWQNRQIGQVRSDH